MRLVICTISCLLLLAVKAQDTTEFVDDLDLITIIAPQQALIARNPDAHALDPFSSLSQTFSNSGFYVKQQGVNLLSTVSYKGLGSVHNTISLGGFPMQSPMNGIIDLSLIPSYHFSTLSETQTNMGYSTMGSTLELTYDQKGERKAVNLGYSSLGAKELAGIYGKRFNAITFRASVTLQHSPNLLWLGHYGVDSFLSNTAIQNYSYFQSIATHLPGPWRYSSVVFLQKSMRQIPSMFSSTDAYQKDQNIMVGNRLNYKGTNVSFELKNQLWDETIQYHSDEKDQHFNNHVFNVNNQLVLNYSKTSDLFTFTVTNNNSFYNATALKEDVRRINVRSKINYLHSFVDPSKKIGAFVEIQPYQSDVFQSSGLQYVSGRTKYLISTVYRIPTLNEYYWFEPGWAMGNPDLKPEIGQKVDIKFRFNIKKWESRLNLYAGRFQSMIVWVGYPEISPINVRSILTRGLEHVLNRTLNVKAGQVVIDFKNHVVLSTYNVKGDPLNPYGKQQIFIPPYTSSLRISFSTERVGVYLQSNFVSRNYFTSDNTAFLDPYFLIQSGSYYSLRNWRLNITIGNLLNEAYYSMPQRPMPGVNAKLNINYTFK